MIKSSATSLVLTAVVLLAAGGQAAAHTLWAFPYKRAPYAMPHDHATPSKTMMLRKTSAQEETPAERRGEIVIAHHKPPYHDGLPRMPRSERPVRR